MLFLRWYREISLGFLGLCLTSCVTTGSKSTQLEPSTVSKPKFGKLGIDTSAINREVAPGDDFFMYANGSWFDSYELKPDEIRYGSFVQLKYDTEAQVRIIIDELSSQEHEKGSLEQKIKDYYSSYMNVEALNRLGVEPLKRYLTDIDQAHSLLDLMNLFGRARVDMLASPISTDIDFDRKNPQRYMLNIMHSGLSLPDKDYYLSDLAAFKSIRKNYRQHIARMFGFLGLNEAEAAEAAMLVFDVERKIAENHWARVDLRNRDKTYNIYTLVQLQTQFPGFDWQAFLKAAGVKLDDVEKVNVRTPSAVYPLVQLIREVPIDVWKLYLKFHLLSNSAAFLSESIADAHFSFFGTVLSGQTKQRDRWKRGVNLVASLHGLGEPLGKIYVARHFPPEAKKKMDELVENLRTAFRQRLNELEWMQPQTKKEAIAKLEVISAKYRLSQKMA